MLALLLPVIATFFNSPLGIPDRTNKHAAATTKSMPSRDDFAAWMLSPSITEAAARNGSLSEHQVPGENTPNRLPASSESIEPPQVNPGVNVLHAVCSSKGDAIDALVQGRDVAPQPRLKQADTFVTGSAFEEDTKHASSQNSNSVDTALNPSFKAETISEDDANNGDDALLARTDPALIGKAPAGAVAHGSANLKDATAKPGNNGHSLLPRFPSRHLLHRSSIAPDFTTPFANSTAVAFQEPKTPAIECSKSSVFPVILPTTEILPRANQGDVSTSRLLNNRSVQIDSAKHTETVARPAVVVGNGPADELEPMSLDLQSTDVPLSQHGLTGIHEVTTEVLSAHPPADVTFAYSFRSQAHILQDVNEDKIVSDGGTGSILESSGTIKGSQPVQRLDVSVDDPVLGNIGLRAEIRGGVLHASISGDKGAAVSMPDLHQFLQRNEISVHAITMRQVESLTPLADTVSRMSGADSALAQSGNSDAQRQDGAPKRESREVERQRESSEREEAEKKVRQIHFPKPTASNPNQGNMLSIHI